MVWTPAMSNAAGIPRGLADTARVGAGVKAAEGRFACTQCHEVEPKQFISVNDALILSARLKKNALERRAHIVKAVRGDMNAPATDEGSD
jgi:hypothetical protein